MKILSVSASNFASYKQLDFQFDNHGLCLIAGPTGSGKSTLCDLIPYALFGRTAKDGVADDVIAWNSNAETSVTIQIEGMTIFRSRKPNDLWYIKYEDIQHGSETRGKDLKDTQKQIDNLLGITYETYMAGAYFHEFSKTASFFTTTAKNRRDICEQIVDLSMAKNLQAKLVIEGKDLQVKMSKLSTELQDTRVSLKYANKTLFQYSLTNKNFDAQKDREISRLIDAVEEFEQNKKLKIKALNEELSKDLVNLQKHRDLLQCTTSDKKCKYCGAPEDYENRVHLQDHRHQMKLVESQMDNRRMQLQNTINSTNPYLKQLEQEEQKEAIPQNEVDELENKINRYESRAEVLEAVQQEFNTKYADYELLADTLQTFRATLIQDTVMLIQNNVNTLLSEHFDGELSVTFDVTQADKVDVLIYKDGNECTFTQLSKGQRQLLKLTFGLSVMKAVANHSGVSFNCIFLDESLSGLDDTIKLKAFRMFESMALSYSSIFVIDHNNDFKSLFSKKYTVSLSNEGSVINEEN